MSAWVVILTPVCAGCGAVRIHGEYRRGPRPVGALTHGICTPCIHERYPQLKGEGRSVSLRRLARHSFQSFVLAVQNWWFWNEAYVWMAIGGAALGALICWLLINAGLTRAIAHWLVR